MLEKPFDRSGKAELSHYAVDTAADRSLRNLAMSVYALAALANQETNAFLRAKNRQAADFPERRNLILFDIRDCYSYCRTCNGAGIEEKAVRCPACQGSGKCTYKDCSNGHWIITSPGPGGPKRTVSTLPCPKCKGQSQSPQCFGVETIKSTCPTCLGKGILFKCPADLTEHYKSLLREMLSLMRSEHEFDHRLQLVQTETNAEACLTLCNKFIFDFAGHPRVGEVRNIKAAIEAEQQRSSALEFALRERTTKNIETLARMAEANPQGAIATIQEYISSHRAELTEPDLLKLSGLKDGCAAKVEKEKKLLKTGYIAGGLLVVLLGLSCINFHFYRYTFLPAYSSPGTSPRKNHGTTLADPLTLSARESRVRAKTKTAAIKPLDG
jgi:hypothetical protein